MRQAIFLQEVARNDIDFSYTGATSEPIEADRHQFGQAMTNVLKNAIEAIEQRMKNEDVDYKGRIAVTLEGGPDAVVINVVDNGIGLPAERDRILEPYVTTREKGTGLGLAIVNKIVEEHGGEMAFAPAPGGGTRVTMRFAREPLAESRSEGGDPPRTGAANVPATN